MTNHIDKDSEARIALLKEMISKRPSAAAFAREFRLNEAHISQIITGRRAFGFRAAANMGEKIAGNPYLFEQRAIEDKAIETTKEPPKILGASNEEAELLDAFARLPDKDKARLLIEAKYRASLADLEKENEAPKLKRAG
jgi:hypothetical protein